MTKAYSGLSASIIALLVILSIIGLIALVVLTAVIVDMPRRRKQKKDTVVMAEEEWYKSESMSECEKGSVTIFTTESGHGQSSWPLGA
jgi:Trk-type K+ transport system membrane component